MQEVNSGKEERIQKILARAGITSRRKAEELIVEGVVTVNGKVAKLGDKATFGKDAIKVRSKLLHTMDPPVYVAFYKPKGVISMLVDTENRPTLTDYISKLEYRLFPVGRLDYMSEGLLLLTNDGDFAEKIQKREDIVRVYRLKLKGHLTEEMLNRLKRGAKVGTKVIRPQAVHVVRELEKKSQVDLVMVGAGAVDIKAMAETLGFLVDKVTRTAIGHLSIHGLAPGHFRVLKSSQAIALLEHPELGMKRVSELESDLPEQPREERPPAIRSRRPAPASIGQRYKTPQWKPRESEEGASATRPFKVIKPRDDRGGFPPRRDDRPSNRGSFAPREDRGPRPFKPRSDRGGFPPRRDDRPSNRGSFAPREDRGPRPAPRWGDDRRSSGPRVRPRQN